MSKSGKPIGIGIIGAAIDRGWASMAHIPALQALDNFEVRAVCTTNRTSADAVAKAFGIARAYDDPAALARDPDVDMIAVTVKASAHHSVITKIVDVRKPILCEWPVGKNAAETTALADLTRNAGVRTFTGLQSRHIPAFRYVHDLIAEGAIGEVLSLDLTSTAGVWGGMVHPGDAYALDAANGATILSIWGGHTLDLIWTMFGEFADVSARLATQRKTVSVLGSAETLPLKAPDNLTISARLTNGPVASIRLRGGPQPGVAFLLEIIGSDGVVSVSGDGIFAMVIDDLKVSFARAGEMELRRMDIPAKYFRAPRAALSPMALNVAQMYAAIADDLTTGSAEAASFADVVKRRAQLERLQSIAETGSREIM